MEKLPLEICEWRNALASCATISMLTQISNLPSRNPKAQLAAYIPSKDGFCIDYLDSRLEYLIPLIQALH